MEEGTLLVLAPHMSFKLIQKIRRIVKRTGTKHRFGFGPDSSDSLLDHKLHSQFDVEKTSE